jgi:hypothetical protein
MERHRLVYAGLALALAALVAVVVALAPHGERPSLPEPLESVFPLPGDSVVRQTAIEVDLPVGYTLDLIVDGRAVPGIEIAVTPSTGVWRWQPAPGTSSEQWSPGEHTITIRWERTTGRPDPGEFTWTFRVT